MNEGRIPFNFVNIVGETHKNLYVVQRGETPIYNGRKGSSRWLTRCIKCGFERIRQTCDVKKGKCGKCDIDYTYTTRSGLSRRKGKIKSVEDRARHLMAVYHLTVEDFNLLLEKQNNLCAICEGEFIKNPCVDHDHRCCEGYKTCGKCIRGLLCFSCNTALGNMKDDVNIFKSAIKHLELGNIKYDNRKVEESF